MSENLSLLPDYSRPTDPMLERIESLLDAPGVPKRWLPHRLIVLNWWQWDYQEFVFAGGWQLYRGQNLSGKSLMLVTLVPFLFDGDKRRYRMDAAGSDSRNIAFYLLGAPEATPESDFYHDERIGYAALEMIHAGTGEIRTIGIGLAARRVGDSQPDVDFWGFVLRDGRRIGRGISLVDPATGAPLGKDPFSKQLGPNPYAESPLKYQEAVNEALFGFADVDQFRRALEITLHLRRPNLHTDMTPQVMCEHLSASLPELDESVLSAMAGTLEDIDKTKKAIRETEEHLQAAQRVDETLGNYLNQIAQQRAVSFLDADQRHKGETRKLESANESLTAATEARRVAERRQEEIKAESSAAAARKAVLEKDEAFIDREKLNELTQDLERAGEQVQREESNVSNQAQSIKRIDERLDRYRSTWGSHVRRQRETVNGLREQADEAEWTFAVEFADEAEVVLGSLTGPDVDAPADFSASSLVTLGEEREVAFRKAEAARREVDAAEGHFRQADERLENADLALKFADDERVRADKAMDRARSDASAALTHLLDNSEHVRITHSAREGVLDRLHLYEDPAGDPFSALDPIRQAADDLVERQESRRADLILMKRGHEARKKTLESEVAELRRRKWAIPTPRPGQDSVRAALREAGIRHAPFYTCVDLRSGVSQETGAVLEAALRGAGMLDALIVATSDRDDLKQTLERLAAGMTGGDAWLDPKAPSCPGRTLADLLEPVEGSVPSDDVLATLRAITVDELGITVSQIGPDGSWRIGVLGGHEGALGAKAPQFIGESNRRRLLQERIATAEDELLEVEIALETVGEEITAVSELIRLIQGEAKRFREIRAISDLRGNAIALRSAMEEVRKKNEAVAKATTDLNDARRRLTDRRLELEEVLRDAPECRNRTVSDIRDLIRSTRNCGTTAKLISADMKQFRDIRDGYAAAAVEAEAARITLEEARVFLSNAKRNHAEIKSRRDALQERLAGMGLEELIAEIEDLRTRIEALGKEREAQLVVAERASERIENALTEVASRTVSVAAAAGAVTDAETALLLAIRKYPAPALLSARKIADDPGQGLLMAADHLLRFRRAERDRLVSMINADLESASRALGAAFSETRGLLAEYSPEQDDEGLIRYRHKIGGYTNPRGLVDDLLERKEQNENTIREKEDELYEEFFLNELSTSIRDRIADGRELERGINRLLKNKQFVNGGLRFSVRWRPREDKGGDYKKLVGLLQIDLLIQPDEKVTWVKEFFRKRIAEVRAAEADRTLEMTYEEALRKEMDYRNWFKFHVYSAESGEVMPIDDETGTDEHEAKWKKRELSGARYRRGSGAQKVLGVFCPLVAAAYVRFSAAAPDAPRLVALDEAFSGVDATNMNEMIRFLVELEFSVVMTSEKVWGVSEALPACTTYDLQSVGGVAAARLWLWDGVMRQADHSHDLITFRPRAVAHGGGD